MATVWNVKHRVLDTEQTKCTCGFLGYKNHKGADLIPKSTSETPRVMAFDDGVVIATGNVSGVNSSTSTAGCGTFVAIRHNNNVITRYQHMKYNSLKVKKGDHVKRGQTLGLYGRPTTGNSDGPHCHFDISLPTKPSQTCVYGKFCGEDRYYIDPKPYLEGKYDIPATDSGTNTEPKKTHKVKSNLNVRSEPSTAGGKKTIVGELKKGTLVTVYEKKNGWCRIGDSEWVAGNYLTAL